MKKNLLIIMATLSVVYGASIPNSGNVLKGMVIPKVPQIKKTIPSFEQGKQKPKGTVASKVKILVKKFIIKGNTVFSTNTLHKLIEKYEGKKLNLQEIEDVAHIITEYYRKNNYFVAHAYIPAQEIDNGEVTIEIQEGKYGTINIKNSSLVKDSVLRAFTQSLKEKGVISLDDLERQLLLLNDLGGARIVKASIFAGKTEGSSDFNIDITSTKHIQTYAIVDNYGSVYTGKYRFGGGINVNSISGHGDMLNLSTIHSTSGGLRNAQIDYNSPLGGSGLKADVYGSITTYKIQGEQYKALDAHGQAGVTGGGFTYPILRTLTHSLYIRTGAKTTHMSDYINGNLSKKHIDDYTLSLRDVKESSLFGKKASRELFLQVTRGKVVLDNHNAVINDALLRTEGYFTKYELSFKGSVFPTQKSMIKIHLSGQKSDNKNLDSSEEISVGGVNGIRAYDSSELSGDKGVLFSLEADYKLPSILNVTHQAGIFFDEAKVWQNSVQYTGLSNDTRQLGDIGVSYALSYRAISLQASYAHGFRIHENTQTNTTYDHDRFYVQLFTQF